MNEIIQGLWIGDRLSAIEQLSIKSFLANGHPYHLYVYEEIKNIPSGTTIKDANEIIKQNRIFKYNSSWGKGSYAGFADLFRYHLLFKNGGWWFDTDVVCLRPINLQQEIIIGTSYEGQWGVIPNANPLKFPKNDPFIQRCIEYCESIDLNNIQYGQIGPHLVQGMVKKLGYQDYQAPYYYFNPIAWSAISLHVFIKRNLKNEIKELIRPFIKPSTVHGRQLHKDSYTVHLWNEVWRQSGLSKEATYHPSSLIEKLKRKYL